MTERVAIVGSREYPKPTAVEDYVYALPDGTVVITGGWWESDARMQVRMRATRGVDYIAARVANTRGLSVALVAGPWAKATRAGLARNPTVVDLCDRLVAFHDGKSTGTMHTVGLARKAGKPVVVFGPDGREIEG